MHRNQTEHPFAEFIRILGKGKKGSRSLTQNEAYRAMSMILRGEVDPIQLGAFLMLIRIKEETAEELAGFVTAAKDSIPQPNKKIFIDLDWSSYAGKRRHLPWFLLSTLLLAENGIRIFMHGTPGHSENRIYTNNVLEHLGYRCANNLQEAIAQIDEHHFSYLSLEHFCPKLDQMINLRPLLGLRSPVHTVVRLLNPLNATHTIQGIFHPGYRQIHQHAACLLNYPSMAVLKGEGGETERNPDVDCLVQSVKNQQFSDEIWPAQFSHRHIKPNKLEPKQLSLLWQRKYQDEYAEATIIGTTAIALKLIGKAKDQHQAHTLANQYWKNRKA